MRVALEFQARSANGKPARVALFPGAYNPPTVAHLAVARAALREADEVIWIVPRNFPHKDFKGATLEDRVEMLRRVAGPEPRFSVALSDGGLYVDIAREADESLEPGTEIRLLCGRDAAERIEGWDYGEPGVFERMIARHALVVAGRSGGYIPAAHYGERIIGLRMESSFNEISSSEVRRRIGAGETWRHLVPESVVDLAARLYTSYSSP